MNEVQWPCQYVDTKGEPCPNKAFFRYHFSVEHPFDHMDVCMEHSGELKFYAWFQLLRDFVPKTKPEGQEE